MDKYVFYFYYEKYIARQSYKISWGQLICDFKLFLKLSIQKLCLSGAQDPSYLPWWFLSLESKNREVRWSSWWNSYRFCTQNSATCKVFIFVMTTEWLTDISTIPNITKKTENPYLWLTIHAFHRSPPPPDPLLDIQLDPLLDIQPNNNIHHWIFHVLRSLTQTVGSFQRNCLTWDTFIRFLGEAVMHIYGIEVSTCKTQSAPNIPKDKKTTKWRGYWTNRRYSYLLTILP